MEFSEDQKSTMDTIVSWYRSHSSELQAFTVGGAAGVGKSFLISHLNQFLPARLAYATFTGKATTILRRNLSLLGIDPKSISTIHSLMYTPVIDKETNEIIGWDKKPNLDADLIVVDEASMIPKELYDDIMSYGIPVLYVGDHHQLPPVSTSEFNLMDDPFIKLETPHRFAADSPIIKLATKIRNREPVSFGHHGGLVFKRRKKDITSKERDLFFQSEDLKLGDAILLCGFNRSRVKLNENVRKTFEYDGLLNYGERVICLRNSTRFSNIPLYNGSIGTVKHISRKYDRSTNVHIAMDGLDNYYHGNIYNDVFGTEKPDLYKGRDKKVQCFDYGYAISGHKSQGSQWKRVAVFEEQCSLWDAARWLYTCVTRSEGELLLITN